VAHAALQVLQEQEGLVVAELVSKDLLPAAQRTTDLLELAAAAVAGGSPLVGHQQLITPFLELVAQAPW
jgi:hypothetical protein